jgi:hypothetical protein
VIGNDAVVLADGVETGLGISTTLASNLLIVLDRPCNSDSESAILARFERRWRSSAGRASDL